MLQIFNYINDYVSPNKPSSKQNFEWQLYLKNEFRNNSK